MAEMSVLIHCGWNRTNRYLNHCDIWVAMIASVTHVVSPNEVIDSTIIKW